MRRILYIATIDQHIRHFHLPIIEELVNQGNIVDVAANGEESFLFVNKKFNICFERSPLKKANLKAYKNLKKIIEENNYDIIHCHTPMGGVIGRLVSKKSRKKGTKVIYTAHGFHFFKGAPLKNWLVYFPVEKFLSYFTDVLITMNDEDYMMAKKKFKMKKLYKIDGVGIDIKNFHKVSKDQKNILRIKNNINKKDTVLIYVAELSSRKNQSLLIDIGMGLQDRFKNITILIVGEGEKEKEYKEYSKELRNVKFLGYRKDVKELLQLSDIGITTSRQEGLPVNVIEMMATGLPVVASKIRGHEDLIINEYNGYLIDEENIEKYIESIEKLLKEETYEKYSDNSMELVDKYSEQNIIKKLMYIYKYN